MQTWRFRPCDAFVVYSDCETRWHWKMDERFTNFDGRWQLYILSAIWNKTMGTGIHPLAGTLVAFEAVQMLRRKKKAETLFRRAKARSEQTGKPLLVIGDPDASLKNRLLGRDYECGSTCIDLRGCERCPVSITSDAYEYLAQQEDDSAVIFVSCVIEYVPDPQQLEREIQRVSNGDSYINRMGITVLRSLPCVF